MEGSPRSGRRAGSGLVLLACLAHAQTPGPAGAPAIEFRLAYDTDLVKVKKIIKRIGEELAADPELGPEMLQPLRRRA